MTFEDICEQEFSVSCQPYDTRGQVEMAGRIWNAAITACSELCADSGGGNSFDELKV